MKILTLLAEGFELTEAAAFIDVFGWNRTFGNTPIYIDVCGKTHEVTSAFNGVLKTNILINTVQCDEYAALAIPGGFGSYGYYGDMYSSEFLEVIHDFNNAGRYIASVCTGAMALSKAGILKGRRATTYHIEDNRQYTLLKKQGANAVAEDIVCDGTIITSCGPSSAPGVALKLLELLTSIEESQKIAQLMGYIREYTPASGDN